MEKDGVLMSTSYAKFLKDGGSLMERIPSELRRVILSYLVPDADLRVYMHSLTGFHGPPSGITLPPIAYVSKTIRADFVLLAVESTTFDIHSGPGNAKFQKWLGRTSLESISKNYKTAFDAVKSLRFSYFSSFHHASMPAIAANNDIELMLKCKNLESVSMVWHGAELIHMYGHAKSVDLLRTQYRLDRMLELGKLKHVILMRLVVGGAASTALDDLAT